MTDQDAERGLYGKYRVVRRRRPGQNPRKHSGCEYFVLDWNHDAFVIPAMKAYAEACRAKFPALAADLDRKIAHYLKKAGEQQ